MIVVSFNGEFTYDPIYNRWNHVNGSMFSLFVPKNIGLNALLDKVHLRLGIDRSDSKLNLKALFTYGSVGNIPHDDILDDETLNGYIEAAYDSKNVIFCVNATPVEANNEPINEEDDGIDLNEEDDGIDLNEDCNAPDDNNTPDYSIGNFPSPVQELATDPNFNPFEQQYGCSGYENNVATQRLGEASDQPFRYQPVRPSHNLSNHPSSSRNIVINSQPHHSFQYPPNQPSSSRVPPIQQPYNMFGGSVTSFLASPFAPHIQTDQTGRDDNNNQGAHARASVREDYSWRIPTFEDDDLPRCLSTGTLHMNDVNELFIGKKYDSKEDFNLKIKSYAVANNFQMSLGRSDTRCLYYTCLNDTCKWHVRAKRVKVNTDVTRTFEITTLNDVHTCASQNADNDNRQATPIVIASLLSQKMEELGNEYKPRQIMEDMLTTYSVQLTYDQAYRAHEMMRMMVRGSPTECYNAIPSYLWMVRKANEGTYIDFQLDNLGRFDSCFMSLGASRRGFKYCRPILCVDATHLKTRFSGQLFIVVAVDAGDHLFPVAFGIAEKECNDSWGYFMRHLRVAIGGIHDENLSFISDRHQAIRNAVGQVFPDAYHGVCYHHLKGNLTKKWKDHGFCEDTFYQTAYAFSEAEFDRKYAMIKAQCLGAYKQLEEIGVERWARAKFIGKRYALMTSNYAESFNCTIRGARRWPVPSLLEFIRATLQRWYNVRRQKALDCATVLAPEIEKIVAENITARRKFRVKPVNPDEFEIHGNNLLHGVVNLRERKCYCGYFQKMEIPCTHAIAAAASRRISPPALCSPYYRAECFKDIYMASIYPIPNREDWDVPESIRNIKVGVPNMRYATDASGAPRRGRINTTRIPSEWERPGHHNVCSNCKHPGHNRASCTQYR